jgi:SAM-dependent methyltransferase
MNNSIIIKQRWIDRWLCSDADELLEREGATALGIAIIDELNLVYQRTGLMTRLMNTILSEAKTIHDATGKPVRILEIGMRDGSLLAGMCKEAGQKLLPIELHGVEFRPNLVALAKERHQAQELPIVSHFDSSRSLDSFASNDFEIVYSTFVLHHQSADELKQLLTASFRISRFSVLHHDLTRSLLAAALIWSFYTVHGYRASRQDALLSCRRAYRPDEVNILLSGLNIGHSAKITTQYPLYWLLQQAYKGAAS